VLLEPGKGGGGAPGGFSQAAAPTTLLTEELPPCLLPGCLTLCSNMSMDCALPPVNSTRWDVGQHVLASMWHNGFSGLVLACLSTLGMPLCPRCRRLQGKDAKSCASQFTQRLQ
jgi:hypothetical protein